MWNTLLNSLPHDRYPKIAGKMTDKYNEMTYRSGTMKRFYCTLASACVFTALAGSSHADVLLLDGIAKEPANSTAGVPRPARGMKMGDVENRFGAPQERLSAVGTPGSISQPPISRWVYPTFTVYFENDHVITSVIKH